MDVKMYKKIKILKICEAHRNFWYLYNFRIIFWHFYIIWSNFWHFCILSHFSVISALFGQFSDIFALFVQLSDILTSQFGQFSDTFTLFCKFSDIEYYLANSLTFSLFDQVIYRHFFTSTRTIFSDFFIHSLLHLRRIVWHFFCPFTEIEYPQ